MRIETSDHIDSIGQQWIWHSSRVNFLVGKRFPLSLPQGPCLWCAAAGNTGVSMRGFDISRMTGASPVEVSWAVVVRLRVTNNAE